MQTAFLERPAKVARTASPARVARRASADTQARACRHRAWNHVVPALVVAGLLAGSPMRAAWAARPGDVTIIAVDEKTGEKLPVRIHLKDQQGKPVEPPKSVFFKNHFVFDGEITLPLRPGNYTFEMERGPEYAVTYGYLNVEPNASDSITFQMRRMVDMSEHGWWAGDLHVHRPLEHIELLMKAEDLHVAPVITWWNDNNLWKKRPIPDSLVRRFDNGRLYHVMAGEDERGGGALLYFNLDRPLEIAGAQREYPSSVEFLKQARKQPGVHVDVEKPFWWDMPIWIASGMVHSIGVCNNHQWRDGVLDNEAWGKPRDRTLYPGAHGNGRWSSDIYYRLLNCGLRIPPSAGSASGVLPNPVGYNRVYVHCGSQLDHATWWRNLRAGQVVVTNGPLLRPLVNGQLPGHVFQAKEGETVELEMELQLSFRSPVEYLEVVQDGRVVHEVRLDEYAKSLGRLPKVKFERSGWLLVRAVTTTAETYRYGTTGPYYVEIGGRPRISKQDAQFFLDWVHERARGLSIKDESQRAQVLPYHRGARDFWQRLVEQANAP